MNALMYPSYHDIAIATMTRRVLSDAEGEIKEIGFKYSECDEASVSFIYIFINLKSMYSSLKREESPNL